MLPVVGCPRHVRGGPCEPRDSARPWESTEPAGSGPGVGLRVRASSSRLRLPVLRRPCQPPPPAGLPPPHGAGASAVSMGTPGSSPAGGGVCHGSLRRKPGKLRRLLPAPRSAPRRGHTPGSHGGGALRPASRPSRRPAHGATYCRSSACAVTGSIAAVSVRRAVGRDARSKLALSWQLPRISPHAGTKLARSLHATHSNLAQRSHTLPSFHKARSNLAPDTPQPHPN